MLVTPPNLPMSNKDGFPWIGVLFTVAIVGVAFYAYSQSTAPRLNTTNNSKKEKEKR
jgi:hypothetical protein